MTALTDVPVAARAPRSVSWSRPLIYAIALIVVGLTAIPVIYVILGGFRSNGQLVNHPAGLPSPWVWENYQRVLQSSAFWHQVLNSTIVALGGTIAVVTLGIMAAFVLARYSF